EVSEIAAGHCEHQGKFQVPKLCMSVNVVERLGNEPRDVNRIGRCEKQRPGKLGIDERLLDEALAVVERTRYFQRRYVMTQRSELLLLNFADLTLWIQDNHTRAGHPKKAVGDRTAGVAGGRDQDNNLPAFLLREMAQKSGHKARAKILECESRPVKKLQRIHAVVDANHGRVKR